MHEDSVHLFTTFDELFRSSDNVMADANTSDVPHGDHESVLRSVSGQNMSDVVGARLTDSEVISSMRFNAILGATCLFIFGLLNAHFKMYRVRLSIRRVASKPPALPKQGWPILWTWLWQTLSLPDEDLIRTAGLDALMLVKTLGLGVQLFVPLTVIGSCVLVPLHKNTVDERDERDINSDSFLRLTISNVKRGSSVFWIHFICVYVFILYAMLLLHFHQKRFINLRHRYLNAHEGANLWRTETRIGSSSLSAFQSFRNTSYSKMFRGAIRQALGPLVNPQVDRSSQTGPLSRLASRRRLNIKKAFKIYQRTGSILERRPSEYTSPRSSPEFGEIQIRSPAADTNEPRSRNNSINQEESGFTFQPYGEIQSAELPTQSAFATVAMMPNSLSANAEINVQPAHASSSRMSGNQSSCALSVGEGRKTSSIIKWWVLADGVTEVYSSEALKPNKLRLGLSRPSVRYLKTINTSFPEEPNNEMAVSAQQYCALLTNFPPINEDIKKESRLYNWCWKLNQMMFGKQLDAMFDCALDRQISTAPNREMLYAHENNGSLAQVAELDSLDEKKLMDFEKSTVEDSLRTFFPHDFDQAMPILNHKELDCLVAQWDITMGLLERSQYYNAHHEVRKKIKQSKWWSIFCFYRLGYKPPVDAEVTYIIQIQELENQIKEARKKTFQQSHAASWLIMFKTQKAASIAAQVLLHCQHGSQFRVGPAPGPDEMNWQSLWKNKREKDLRNLIVIPFIFLLLAFPLGIFAGSLSRLTEFLCDDPNDGVYWKWYCEKNGYRRQITSWVPAILVTIWQNMIMPNGIYYLVQASAGCDSLSQLERRIAHLFFLWDFGNIFLGAMLGGSVIYQINAAVKRPQDLMELIGLAVPASSNFFVNYVTLRAFFLVPYQLLLPHPGIWFYLVRFGGRFGFSKTLRDKAILWGPRSIRYGREYGVFLLMFLISIAYSVISPIILPITLAYFLMAWLVWRYQVLYVFVRKYESGGRMWPLVVSRLIFSLWVFQVFTSCVLVTKEAYWQAAILWITVPIILHRFYIACESRFRVQLAYIPLEMAHHSPPATVHPEVYTAPALMEGCPGWHPEYMKAWEGWGSPTYTL